jgi:hypothetical protein
MVGCARFARQAPPETNVKANQASAVAALEILNAAAETYESGFGTGYPPSLAVLGRSADGAVTADRAGLIDPILASGKKSGYTFTYRPGPVVNGCVEAYTVTARPVAYGKTGVWSFFTDQNGMIRQTEYDRDPTGNDQAVLGYGDQAGGTPASEAEAVRALRTINMAALTYASTYAVGFPPSLVVMGEGEGPASQEHAGLLAKDVANGTKSGYIFTYRPSPASGGGIWAYRVVARPKRYSETGTRSFSTDQTGVIRQTEEDREPIANDLAVGRRMMPGDLISEAIRDTGRAMGMTARGQQFTPKGEELIRQLATPPTDIRAGCGMTYNQERAVSTLRTVYTSVATYATMFNAGFPNSLAALGPSADDKTTPDRAGLVDSILASGKKSGYTFAYQPAPAVRGRVEAYTVVARPTQYGKTGVWSYFTDQTGTIRRTEYNREPTPHDPPVSP